jgi:hypothetical protein
LRLLKEKAMTGDHAVIHIDFSESYLGKSVTEVQATHFGGHDEITLHQGVLYVKVCVRVLL